MTQNILSPRHRKVLEHFAWSNVLLALDYDGTLAPIVTDPERAMMRPVTRGLLEPVAKLYKVIVVSGRAQPDALRRMRGVGIFEVVGNHGVEPRHTSERFISVVQRWMPLLRARVEPLQGVVLEDKIYSVAIHYRNTVNKKLARATILEAAASLGDVRLVGGKQVVNLLPKGAPGKGNALERERERLCCDTAIYVGDDETDEDVFALDQPTRLLSIRVGEKRTSAANYCLNDQRAIDSLLRVLLKLRNHPRFREHSTAFSRPEDH
jgi:trehalose 6-phosphate phosphatase